MGFVRIAVPLLRAASRPSKKFAPANAENTSNAKAVDKKRTA